MSLSSVLFAVNSDLNSDFGSIQPVTHGTSMMRESEHVMSLRSTQDCKVRFSNSENPL